MAEVSQNIFASNVGCNFSDEFVDGFNHRFKSFPPEYIANITLFVNTKRLLESIKKSFLIRSPGFLPKIFSITDLRALAIEHTLPGLLNLQKEQLNLNELIKEERLSALKKFQHSSTIGEYPSEKEIAKIEDNEYESFLKQLNS